MTPLIESSVNTLVDVVGKNADTGKSIEFYKYALSYSIVNSVGQLIKPMAILRSP